MSLHYDTFTSGNEPRTTDAPSATTRHSLAPLVHQVVESYRARKILEIRKATQSEISHLPVGLQQDLAFADGTVIPFRAVKLYG